MNLAIEKAKRCGVGFVAVKNSTHVSCDSMQLNKSKLIICVLAVRHRRVLCGKINYCVASPTYRDIFHQTMATDRGCIGVLLFPIP